MGTFSLDLIRRWFVDAGGCYLLAPIGERVQSPAQFRWNWTRTTR